MNDLNRNTKQWLRLVQEYTDLALLPSDAGIHKDGIPPLEVKRLGKMVGRVGDRVVITKMGRKFLKGEIK